MLSELNQLKRSLYFDTYLEYIEQNDYSHELEHSRMALIDILEGLSEAQWNHRYAEDKWSVKEVLQHIIDTDLVFLYRALRIGRETQAQSLDGFDQDRYVVEAQVESLSGSEMLEAFNAQRDLVIFMSKTFSPKQLKRCGTADGNVTEVQAFFFIMAGHTWHHLRVLQERYLS